MKKGCIQLLSLIFLISLVIPLTSAVQTTVEVRTSADYSIILRILDSQTKAIADSAYGKADNTGLATINFNTTRSEVAFTIIVVYNGEIIKKQDTEVYPAGGKISFNMDDTPTVTANATQQNVTTSSANTSNESLVISNSSAAANESENITETASVKADSQSNQYLTGNAIAKPGINYSKILIYVIIIILVGGIFLFVMKKMNKTKAEDEIINEAKSKQERKMSVAQELNDAQNKLMQAKREIDDAIKRTRSSDSHNQNRRF